MSNITYRLAVSLIVWLLLAVDVRAQTPSPGRDSSLTVDNLIQEIRRNNPLIAERRTQAEAAKTVGRQMSSLPDPQLMITALPAPVYTARGIQRAQIRIEQSIPFPGKRRLLGQIADLDGESAFQAAASTENELILQAKQAYFEVYRIERQKGLVEEFSGRLRDFENIAATRYEVGQGPQQAILKAQLERSVLSNRELTLDRSLLAAAETLEHLLNRKIDGSELEHLPPQNLAPLTADADSLYSRAMDRRPEARTLQIATERADARIDLSRKQYLPDFGVSLTYFDIAETDRPPGADGQDALAIGFSVKIPLYRSKLDAGVEQARLLRNSVDAARESLESAFRSRIQTLLGTLREDVRQLDLYRDVLIPQAETTLAATVTTYAAGSTDFLNLLDAERTLFELRVQLEDTTARLLKTRAQLEYAVGVDFLR